MITTPDGVNLFTQEDYDNATTQQFHAGVEFSKRSISESLRDKAIEWFKAEAESTMSKEDALNIFNGLAEALGWDTIESIATKFTVLVNYLGNTVAEFSGVEADSDDEAIEKVMSGLEVVDAELSLRLSYDNDTCYEQVDISYDFDTDDLEYSAEED